MSNDPHRTDPLMTPAERLDAAHTAVVVVDMQKDFCAEDGYVEQVVGRPTDACRDLVAPLGAFLDRARACGVPVIWVRAIYDHDKIPPGMLAKQRQNGEVVCCGTGSEGAEFFGVTPEPGEMVADKHSYSAFVGTDLGARLRELGIRSLVFTGVQTNVCVDTSLRDAVCEGFYAAIAADCVASHAPGLHDATLANVQALFGDVMPSDGIAEIWDGSEGAAS